MIIVSNPKRGSERAKFRFEVDNCISPSRALPPIVAIRSDEIGEI